MLKNYFSDFMYKLFGKKETNNLCLSIFIEYIYDS